MNYAQADDNKYPVVLYFAAFYYPKVLAYSYLNI